MRGFSTGQGEINIKQSTKSYQQGNQRGNKWANTNYNSGVIMKEAAYSVKGLDFSLSERQGHLLC